MEKSKWNKIVSMCRWKTFRIWRILNHSRLKERLQGYKEKRVLQILKLNFHKTLMGR